MENLLQENMFEIRRPNKARRNLSQKLRKNMMAVGMTSSPLYCHKNKQVEIRNVELKEEINERSEDERIKLAVERLSDDVELIADCSRPYSLPTVCGKHKDLKSISPQTVEDLLNGKYPTVDTNYMILDCRYPYEFDVGHIQGAVNTYIKDSIDNLLHLQDKPRILIFHCEFSSQRAPTLLRYLRSQDRLLNSDNYPSLYYPEVYILDGGYKAYEQSQNLCKPCDYIQMLDQKFSEELSISQNKKSRGNRSREDKLRKPRVIRF